MSTVIGFLPLIVQCLRHYQEDFEQKCQKLQQAFDAEIQAFGMGDEDNDEDNHTDKNTINSSPTSDNTINGPRENGTGEGSPGVGPFVSTIVVNGADSPVKDGVTEDTDGDTQESTGDEKLENHEKMNSKEELTSM